MPATKRVWLVAASEHFTGLWCSRCLLPSGFSMLFTLQGEDGSCSVGALTRCFDCLDAL